VVSQKIPAEMQAHIEEGIATLKRGGTVSFPTDTVYGLGVDIYNEGAIKKIFKLKGRPESKALPILVADVAQLEEMVEEVPSLACRLMQHFLTGRLTMILPKTSKVSDIITGGADTVAVRITEHPVPIALIEGLGSPIVATSANLSGKPSALTAEEVIKQFGNSVDYVVDGGRSPAGRESTIIDFTGQKPKVVREGAIKRSELELFCKVE